MRYEAVPDAWVAKLAEHFHIPWRELRMALADVAPLIIASVQPKDAIHEQLESDGETP